MNSNKAGNEKMKKAGIFGAGNTGTGINELD